MKRGEVEIFEDFESSYRMVKSHFLELKTISREVLKSLIGVSLKSQLFYSPKYHSIEEMEIRMAK